MKKVLAKKLGEVCAFAKISLDTYTRGEEALTKVFDTDYIKEIQHTNEETVSQLEEFMNNQDQKSVFENYSNTAEKKITEMRRIYLEDKWNETDEVLEWLGFVEGSAAVHWSLVEELSAEEGLSQFDTIAAKMKSYHTQLLQKMAQAIKKSE